MTRTSLCTTHEHLRFTFVWWAPLHTGEHQSRRKRSPPRNCLCHLGIEDGGWYCGVITATELRDPHGFLCLIFLDCLIHMHVKGQQCFEQVPLLWQCFQHPLRSLIPLCHSLLGLLCWLCFLVSVLLSNCLPCLNIRVIQETFNLGTKLFFFTLAVILCHSWLL